MTGNIYIDEKIDAYSKYGVFVIEGGYDELVEYAPLKKVASNNWQEEDGEEFDLSAPVLDSRELSIKFAAHGSNANIGAFIEMLSDKAYHMFEFRQLERTYELRLVSQPNLTLARQFGLVTLRFAYDTPAQGYEYKAPNSEIVPVQRYEIYVNAEPPRWVDFSQYGVRILQGTFDEIMKLPSVKKNLMRNSDSQSGAIYDGEVVTFETKDVKLNCLMRANTLSEFWQNYDALLFDLTRPNEQTLYVESTGYEYPFYYKSCKASEFYPKDKIWFKFDLTLVFTSFRVGADEYILASEQDEWIVTEEGSAIDLNDYFNI